MKIDRTHLTLASVTLLLAATVFAYLFTDRYYYFDYSQASCESEGLTLKASLVGTFNKQNSKERGNPYYFRMELEVPSDDDWHIYNLNDVSLNSLSSKTHIRLGNLQRVQPKNSAAAKNSIVYLVNSIDIPYEDFQGSGVISVQGGEKNRDAPFSCTFKKKYRDELRISLWDNLMSV